MPRPNPAIRNALVAAERTADVVKIKRRIPKADRLEGVVVGIGPHWALLHDVAVDTILNGYVAIRIADVRKVETDSTSFSTRALHYFNQAPRRPDDVDLSSIQALLTSAAQAFPLITIHTEIEDPTICFIGQPVGVVTERVILREIAPGARWATGRRRHWDVNDITRIEFGGRYEEALFALASKSQGKRT